MSDAREKLLDRLRGIPLAACRAPDLLDALDAYLDEREARLKPRRKPRRDPYDASIKRGAKR